MCYGALKRRENVFAVCIMKTQHDYWQESHDQTIEQMKKHSNWQNNFDTKLPMNNITCLAGGAEMLRVTPEGFWVRGVKVAQDDTEAEAVYNAFKAWMSWAQLNRDYK